MENPLFLRRALEFVVGDAEYRCESARSFRTTHLRSRIEELQYPEVGSSSVVTPDLIVKYPSG
jgi:hypothetical protein